MKSPFAVFRKHQKVLMVVVIGLAMFAFIFMDQMSRSGGQAMVLMMGPMLGAIVFWIIGTQKGKATSYAMTGALLGLLLGLLGLQMGAPAATVETTIGDLSQTEVQQLVSLQYF